MPLLALFNAGRGAEMEAEARALLARNGDDAEAAKALGMALQLQRKDALAVLEQAAQGLPNDAELASAVGSLHAARGALDVAGDWLQRAIRLRPSLAAAHSNLADVWLRLQLMECANYLTTDGPLPRHCIGLRP